MRKQHTYFENEERMDLIKNDYYKMDIDKHALRQSYSANKLQTNQNYDYF